MPPKRAKKAARNTVTVAASRHLADKRGAAGKKTKEAPKPADAVEAKSPTPSPARTSRVLSRRTDIGPQEAPAWQKKALKQAVKDAKQKGKKKPAAKVSGRRGRRATPTRSSSSRGSDDTASSASEDDETSLDSGSDASTGRTRKSQRGRRSTAASASPAAKPRRAARARGSGEASEEPESSSSPKRAGRRPKKEDRLCPQCRLLKDEWPFCGLTGDAHVMPDLVAA